MKIAVLGGSFNPLHIGHVMLADTVCVELGYDKVVFVPTAVPPHKILQTKVSPEERLALVDAFCKTEGSGRFEASDCEIARGGVSYTIDTLKFLSEKYKSVLDGKIAFIMGEEIAAEFHKWRNPENIIEIADIIVARRHPNMNNVNEKGFENKPSGNYAGEFNTAFNPETFSYPFVLLENPVFPVSSTEIRARIAGEKAWKMLVPDGTRQFVEKNNLYKN